ncbi:GGDEF domain-containing protein [Photobacterium aphoticum]|nr:GGDEF domain-containing protein [Photobacterium aphoticum]
MITVLLGAARYKYIPQKNEEVVQVAFSYDDVPKELLTVFTGIINQNPTMRKGSYSDIITVIDDNDWFKDENHTVRFFSYFIKAYGESNKANYPLALAYLNQANRYIDEAMSVDILARYHYEFSYVQLHLKLVTLSKESFSKVEQYYDGTSNVNLLIPILLARAYDLSHSERGAELAIQQTEKTLALAESTHYEKIEHVYYTLGLNYWNGKRIVEGINYKIKALELYMDKQLHEDVIHILTDIGIDYLFMGDTTNAIKYLTDAIGYEIDGHEPGGESIYYIANQLYTAHSSRGDLVQAEKYLLLAEEEVAKIERQYVKDNHLTYLSLIKADFTSRQGDSEAALHHIEIAEDRFKSGYAGKIYHFDIKMNMTYGDIYQRRGEHQQALQYYKQAETFIHHRGVFYLIDDINERLYKSYKALGEWAQTIAYLEKNNQIIKEQRDDHNAQYSQYIYGEFDVKNKEERIQKLQSQSETSRISLLLSLLLLFGMVLFTVTLKYKNRRIVELNKSLATISFTDGLTSVANRHALDQLWQTWETSKDDTLSACAIIMIDIDYFKRFNDYYGHHDGDQALKRVAAALQRCCRPGDFVGRYGGEEFIMVLPGMSGDAVTTLVKNRIQPTIGALNIAHAMSDVSDRITLSIGIASGEAMPEQKRHALMNIADKALYQAKEQGRDQYVHLHYAD